MGALRGVLAAEEGSARLAAAERQAQLAARRQRRRGGAQQVPGGDDGEVGVVVVGGGGAADAAGEDGESDSDDGDDGGDDEQQRDERASSSAALSALQAALEECEAAAEALAEAGEQVRRYADVARYDAGAAAALSCRLELVEKLCRRFRVRSSSELLALADGWAAQLEGFYEGAGEPRVRRRLTRAAPPAQLPALGAAHTPPDAARLLVWPPHHPQAVLRRGVLRRHPCSSTPRNWP